MRWLCNDLDCHKNYCLYKKERGNEEPKVKERVGGKNEKDRKKREGGLER